MKTQFKESFARDLRHIRERSLLARIRQAIENVEEAKSLEEIPHLRKLQGGDHCYRIRVGDYRIGVVLEDDVVIFVRVLNRRDVYRYFP